MSGRVMSGHVRLAGLAALGAVVATGCSPASSTATSHPTTIRETALVIADLTGSAQHTDLVSMARSTAMDRVAELSPGEALVVSSFTRDVTVACNPVVVALAKQNPARERQARASLPSAVAGAFDRYHRCVVAHDPNSGSEIFGGIATALADYPDAVDVTIVTDGCENVSIRAICDPAVLRRTGVGARVVDSLPARLVPKLTASVQLRFVGIGRGTGLDASSVAGLRSIWSTWAARTGATSVFEPTD